MKKIILFGDSIAAGLMSGSPSDILDNYITSSYFTMYQDIAEVHNLGKAGDSTTTALERIEQAKAIDGDIIIINVGVNDAINIKDNLIDYKENLQKMVQAFPNKNVVLLGPSFVDKAKKTQVDDVILQQYLETAKIVASETHAHFIDVFHHMTNFSEPLLYLQEDGLHPSNLGYHLLSVLITGALSAK